MLILYAFCPNFIIKEFDVLQFKGNGRHKTNYGGVTKWQKLSKK